MNARKALLLAAISALTLGGCATNDELLSEKDRELNERNAENEALRKRIADAEAVRLVMQKDGERNSTSNDAAAAEAARLRQQNLQLLRDLEAERQRANDLASAPARPAVAQNAPTQPTTITKKADGLEVEERANGDVILRLDSRVSFPSGSATLTKQGQGLLRKDVARLLGEYDGYGISVEGHTDDTPIKRSRWKSNLNLSIARALEVRRYLSGALKVSEDRMRVVGYGDKRPLETAKTKSARAKNRRVEIVLYKNASDN